MEASNNSRIQKLFYNAIKHDQKRAIMIGKMKNKAYMFNLPERNLKLKNSDTTPPENVDKIIESAKIIMDVYDGFDEYKYTLHLLVTEKPLK